MAKREFLQLAHNFNGNIARRTDIGGWYASEKLDGIRCFWDGGVSRGIPKSKIPWANTAKDARYRVQPIATGLWTRYGNVIHAPDSWLNTLPLIPLDGELFVGRGEGTRQTLTRIVKTLEPIAGLWLNVAYHVFDVVPLGVIFADGVIDNPNFRKTFKGIPGWVKSINYQFDYMPSNGIVYNSTVKILERLIGTHSKIVFAHKQTRLPLGNKLARDRVTEMFNEVSDLNGEGLIIRHPHTVWEPARLHTILKLKAERDAEASIIGYISGRETDRGSKLRGLIGAFILQMEDGTKFELSGFTDEERQLETTEAFQWAYDNPGEVIPPDFEALHFKRGDVVTFKYRELTKDGVPSEARYWRKRIHA